jgi:dienelactone hydrolase
MVFARLKSDCRKAALVFALIGLGIFSTFLSAQAEPLQAKLDLAYPSRPVLGPVRAKGAVIWSHGRSITTEDSLSPTPYYMAALRDAGWEAYRFNRLRAGDTLQASSEALVEQVSALKAQGYRRIVLAGQSFGAFLSLIAADESPDIHAVIATAPAAYGSFADFYDSWQKNATRLYPILERIKRARVMLFFFHGDDFDPGGRGEHSEAILSAHNIDHLVFDQPPDLTTHWAASSGLFVRRFGPCIRSFIESASGSAEGCDESWGARPSAELRPPGSFHPAIGRSGSAGTPFSGSWYGYYPNGREVLFTVENTRGNEVTALYGVGPGIQPGQKAEWVQRTGRMEKDELVFKERGRNTLHYRLREDGLLDAVWESADGKSSLEATLHRTDWPQESSLVTASGDPADPANPLQ